MSYNMSTRSRILFLLSGCAIFLVILAFVLEEQTIYIHLQDTYYVFSFSFIHLFFSGIIWMVALLYRLLYLRMLSIYLTWIHIILTVSIILLFNSYPYWPISEQRRYIDFSNWSYTDSIRIKILYGSVMIFMIAQLLFLINIIAGIIRKKNFLKS